MKEGYPALPASPEAQADYLRNLREAAELWSRLPSLESLKEYSAKLDSIVCDFKEAVENAQALPDKTELEEYSLITGRIAGELKEAVENAQELPEH